MLKYKTINSVFLVALAAMLVYGAMATLAWWYFLILAMVYLAIVGYGTSVLSAEFFLPVRYRGDQRSNRIAITFDDGPIPGHTEKALEILNTHGVKAAFFCIGNRIAAHPNLTKQIHTAGHLVGNHSYWHAATFDLQTSAQIAKELTDTDKVIEETIGEKPNFFRPPYGVTNPMLASAVKKGGYKTIGWSVRSFDTMSKDAATLMQRVTKSLKGGDVVLFHDYCDITLEILPAFLDHVAKRGLKIVRIDELLNERAYA
jgi:peptidoglycan/xylan/chitin deacetylase (PgdA/CDA1 family)